jgi:hypothetical protein
MLRSRGSSVSIVSDYGLDDRHSILDRGGGFFLSPLLPDRLWGPPSLLYNGYRWSFPRRLKAAPSASMACSGITLPFTFKCSHSIALKTESCRSVHGSLHKNWEELKWDENCDVKNVTAWQKYWTCSWGCKTAKCNRKVLGAGGPRGFLLSATRIAAPFSGPTPVIRRTCQITCESTGNQAPPKESPQYTSIIQLFAAPDPMLFKL